MTEQQNPGLGAFAELAAITDPAHPWSAAIREGQEFADRLLAEETEPTPRRRHYILSLQRAGALPIHVTTVNGIFEGDDSEEDAFRFVWRTVCQRTSDNDDVAWTTENTTVLFYRLAEA